METNLKLNITLLLLLFAGNIIINNYNYYFRLIYLFLSLYHIYISYLLLKYHWKNIFIIIIFAFISIIIYRFTYIYICDTNPYLLFLSYYIFYPNFVKAIIIVFIHTFILSLFYVEENNNFNFEDISLQKKNSFLTFFEKRCSNFYFLSSFINYFIRHKIMLLIFIVVLFFGIKFEIYLFLHRIKLWVYFNSKEKTLPIASSKNTTFYITAMIVNMEKIIHNYIEQMKKLINYLGETNVIISIVENRDSMDKTREYLIQFQNYLNERKIKNKFLLKHEIDDPRKKVKPYRILSNLRIKYYSELRNKCLDYLYELPNIDFNNTKIIFFNDIIFSYEDIINLLATNNEDYDAVCGLDFYDIFYDTWVSIDLDGNSLTTQFPYFINKEAQDLLINHKPIRVFSCWNGIIAFNASPLKDKKIKFRYEKNPNKERKYLINNSQVFNYESECTYFHIDLFALGYTKKFINPDVRVAYHFEHYFMKKYYNLTDIEINNYYDLYYQSLNIPRNKLMSNYKDKNIKLNSMIENWYLENKENSTSI